MKGETVWQLTDDTGLVVPYVVARVGAGSTLTVTDGAAAELAEPFTERASALEAAGKYLTGARGIRVGP